jgi:hypothetical protein
MFVLFNATQVLVFSCIPKDLYQRKYLFSSKKYIFDESKGKHIVNDITFLYLWKGKHIFPVKVILFGVILYLDSKRIRQITSIFSDQIFCI